MHVEKIVLDGEQVLTLKERLSPSLKAILVGINPSPVSVASGHYYQGRLGKRLWQRLKAAGMLVGDVTPGFEDDAAFEQGFGMTDLIRRPTASATDLSVNQKTQAVADLIARLQSLPNRPPLLFVFKEAFDLAKDGLGRCGFNCHRLPGPYAARSIVEVEMANLRRVIFERSQ